MKKYLIILTVFFLPQVANAAARACTSSESWENLELPKQWRERYSKYISGRYSPMQGMAFARQLRKESTTRFEDLFSQYWISHSLQRAELYPLALDGFNKLLKTLPKGSTYNEIREASFLCVTQVHHHKPARRLSKSLYSSWRQLPSSPLKDYLAFRWALEQKNYKTALKSISPESPLKHLVGALKDWKNRDWKDGAAKMDQYFMAPSSNPYVRSQVDLWRIFAARLHFSASTFSKAEKYLAKVDKRANALVPALTELAWTQLKAGQYNAAIGTSLSLQTGWLQSTYSPESIMVMSMAFNETCYYPEAMRSLDLLKRQYGPVQAWLKGHKKLKGSELYEELKLSLKKEGDVPFRLSSEWIRSPIYLSRQEEVNHLIQQGSFARKLEDQTKVLQGEMVADLLKQVREVRLEIERFQAASPTSVNLPPEIAKRLNTLRSSLEEYDSLRSFAPVWKLVKRSNKKTSAKRQGVLLREIHAHIKNVNRRVSSQINDINDNIKFVEIEVYQGATQDVIFSNANPDFSKKISELKKKKGFKLKSDEMRWGSISTSQLGQSEIWEDELGGFKADLPNKCNKARVAKGN